MSERKIIQVNYWKKMLKETKEVVGKLHGVVLLIHNSVEFSDIINFLNKVRPNEELKVLYISFINSYRRIGETIKNNNSLHSKDLFVVDCVSGFLVNLKDTPDCAYRQPPSNLEGLKKLIMGNIGEQDPNIVVVDSLSQFINFSMPKDDEINEFYRFLRDIRENIFGLAEDSILLLYDENVAKIQKLPTISLDLILRLEVIRDKPRWKD